ncbi:MAG: ATP-binding protein [Pirellulaceae bacterium]|nr:ATP-binding protein [Pirellulaceae bacterium]
MTFRRIDIGDESTHDSATPSASAPDPAAVSGSQSLRERALAAYQQRISNDSHQQQYTIEETQRAIHELQVHQIELEMQNEELRQSQFALDESRLRYRDLYDRAPVGYCLIGHSGMIQEANHTLADMLGFSPNLLNQERFSKFVSESGQDTFYLLRRRLLASAEPQTCELRLLKCDGKELWVQLSASLATENQQASMRVVIVDIDARIRAEAEKASLEAQLRESQKMEAMGTLAGGIAHDFNNILAVILGNTELAKHYTPPTDLRMVHCVEEIQKASERARDLVKQLLAFCRRQPTDRQSIPLGPVIEDCIRLLRATIPARVSLMFSCAPNVPNVLADTTQIEQVIINLATNAVQALNGKGGSIQIKLDAVERPEGKGKSPLKMVRINFTDDGPGIESSVINRIFEPFFTTKPVDEGTGLGLAVVHGIIRAHDGEISVESQVGHGTTFTILLPPNGLDESVQTVEQGVVPADLERRSTTAAHASHVAPLCRVLYIDDDEMVLQSLVNLFGHYGIQVRGYTDQLTALAALRAATTSFDLVVTDYNMPGLSGLDVAKQVREIRADLPVIVTSGFIDEELHAHADEAGVRALIPKPFSAQYFCDLVQKLLNAPIA